MIGDWVYRPDCYDQVKEIKHAGIIGIDNMRGLITFSELEPIPLTSEILEKNGFVEWSDKCYRWEYAEGIYINADFTEEEPWAHISNRCYSATPVCRYVHEFQHAMRLCGIDKKIVL